MENQLVVFALANEHYGVDIAAVEAIIKMQAITAVPRAAQFVEGVINLRGKVLPVIDLRERFGLPKETPTKDSRIIVMGIDGTTVGMVVDGVSEVLRVGEEAIEPPSKMVATADSAFITGIAKIGERLVILLDLSRVLNSDEQFELTGIADAA